MEFTTEGFRDVLTGVMTPQLFYESAERLRSWANRSHQSLSLIAIELSGITHETFVKSAREIEAEMRGGDLVTRLKMDTLVVMLIGDSLAADHVIQRLDDRIRPRPRFRKIELEEKMELVVALDYLAV